MVAWLGGDRLRAGHVGSGAGQCCLRDCGQVISCFQASTPWSLKWGDANFLELLVPHTVTLSVIERRQRQSRSVGDLRGEVFPTGGGV